MLFILSSLISVLYISRVYSGKKCAYLALEGIGYPVDKCMFQASSESNAFAFEFLCGKGNTVSAKYWESVKECRGDHDLEMDDYYCSSPPDLTGQECKCVGRGAACDTFTIKMKIDSKCENEDDQSTSIVVNECIPTGYGGSSFFQCDDEILEMKTFSDCSDCSCFGEYAQFDYAYLNDNYCFDIKCSEGSRKIQKCEERGMNANKMQQADLSKFGIGGLSKHIKNHHLFIKDIITKHQSKNKSIWSDHKLIYGVGSIAVIMIFILIIRWFKYNKQYTQI